MSRKSLLPLLAFGLIVSLPLASCGGDQPDTPIDPDDPNNPNSPNEPVVTYDETAKISVSTDASVENKVYNPTDVEITMTMSDFEKDAFYNTQVMPSLGEVNILVVPVLIPEYDEIDIDNNGTDDKDKVRSDLETLFFGDPTKDERLEFGSLASFYKESSYGKLNITGTVTEWYDVQEELGYKAATQITSSVTDQIVKDAVENYRAKQNDKLKSFDSDSDGYLDAVWLVYSAPNYTNGGPNLEDMNYWAYTGWANQDSQGDVDDPVANVYSWASYDFMYEAYGNQRLDTHTYIHETGHLLGLNDYYSTDTNGASYSPLGKVDMMDNNIIDHNLYSKMLLGWTKPTLVYGSAEIELNSMQNKDSLIVLQSDDAEVSNEFNPFSEYVVIELYTNEGLNNKDATTPLNGGLLAPKDTGVRIYHIDKRLWTIVRSDSLTGENSMVEYDGENLYKGLVAPVTNSRNSDTYNYNFNLPLTVNLYDEIRLIERSGTNTFSQGGYQTNRSYFKDGDSFSITSHSDFFVNGNTFDNGETFSYSVEVAIDE